MATMGLKLERSPGFLKTPLPQALILEAVTSSLRISTVSNMSCFVVDLEAHVLG
jgi:hypothetical protein